MVFRKMMVAAAWGMDGGTHLWAGNADRPADPTGRYEVIKIFRVNVDHYKFYKEVFDKLPVELMRWVFENRISNEELPWLANYTLNFKKADGSVPNESERLGAYTYTYTDSKGGMAGISSMLHGMPGHAATLKYTLKENKATGKTEPCWVIQNNVTLDEGAGWQSPCSPARMLRRPRSIWRDPLRKCAS